MTRSRSRLAVGVVGTLLLSTGVACSLLTDLNGLASGAPPTAVTDGGPLTDGAPADDGGVGGQDSAVDGTPGSDGGVTPVDFCAGTMHAFCADFEDADPFAAWTQKYVDLGTTGTLSTTHATSPSHSFFATTPARAASTPNVGAVLEQRFSRPWRRIVVELDIYEDQPAWTAGDVNAGILSVETQSGTNGKAWFLVTGPNYTNLGDVSRAPMATGQCGNSMPASASRPQNCREKAVISAEPGPW